MDVSEEAVARLRELLWEKIRSAQAAGLKVRGGRIVRGLRGTDRRNGDYGSYCGPTRCLLGAVLTERIESASAEDAAKILGIRHSQASILEAGFEAWGEDWYYPCLPGTSDTLTSWEVLKRHPLYALGKEISNQLGREELSP